MAFLVHQLAELFIKVVSFILWENNDNIKTTAKYNDLKCVLFSFFNYNIVRRERKIHKVNLL